VTQRQVETLVETRAQRTRLGEVLVRHGTITREQLNHALASQKRTRGSLGQILVKLGYVDDPGMRQALAVHLDIPYLDLDRMTLDRSLSKIINRTYARRHSLVPIAASGNMLTVCMDDPTQRAVVEDLTRSTGHVITVVTASHESIRRALIRIYEDRAKSQVEALEVISEEEGDPRRSRYASRTSHTEQVDVLVRKLISVALSQRASDVHIEMLSNRLQVRFRIDGVLEQLEPGDLQDSCNRTPREVISRLKILGKLDIAERRRPQDGSFRVKVESRGEQRGVDLRISVVPSHYGESVVLRILDKKNAPTSLDQLHFPQAVTQKLRELLDRPSGILLVTGPTGSGKSTTLYGALMTVNRPGIRILTAEDPIEYIFESFSQAEVNEQIGNTFASYLRAFLRHDPEVIMVGEIRDEETAEMAFRAAQTGHLLLSTLHTITASGAIPRLIDLKVDPNTLASSLIGVVGQRLVRRVCNKCTVPYEPAKQLLREFFDERPADLVFRRGEGCMECNLTGYRGRLTIVELWVPSQEDVVLINKSAPVEEIRTSARASTISMAENAWLALCEGQTNLEELMRMLPYDAISDFKRRRFGDQTPTSPYRPSEVTESTRKREDVGSDEGGQERNGTEKRRWPRVATQV
jgi:type IV pilus assembly protein PilB